MMMMVLSWPFSNQNHLAPLAYSFTISCWKLKSPGVECPTYTEADIFLWYIINAFSVTLLLVCLFFNPLCVHVLFSFIYSFHQLTAVPLHFRWFDRLDGEHFVFLYWFVSPHLVWVSSFDSTTVTTFSHFGNLMLWRGGFHKDGKGGCSVVSGPNQLPILPRYLIIQCM